MASNKDKRVKRDSLLKNDLLERAKDIMQAVLNPLGDTTKVYIRSTSTDFTKATAKIFGTSDLTNNLCSILEAILIHGIKDSYATRVSSFFKSDPDRMPVPNFWPVVMSVSHKDDIKEVCSLAFITSDVGRGRAWLRLVINGGQFTSYIDALTREDGVLKDYYNSSALLRDPESCDQLIGVMQLFSSLQFQLATNSSILNTWTQTPLVLAGLWVPPMGHHIPGWTEPVRAATDAAAIVPDEEVKINRSEIFMEETSLNDHLFNAILAATPDTQFIGAAAGPDIEEQPKRKPLVVRTLYPKTDIHGNPYVPPTGLLADHIEEETELTIEEEENDAPQDNIMNVSIDSGSLVGSFILDRTVSDDGSTITSASSLDYETLISKRLDNVDYRYIPDGYLNFAEENETAESDATVSPGHSSTNSQEYEMVPDREALQATRLSSLVSRLCNQYGLDEQNYQCYQCRAFIGMFYGEFRVCSMDGRSYCFICHSDNTGIIPARLLMNWDLRQYPVCTTTSKWLEENYVTPMLDIRAANPKLYAHVDELRQLKTLRTQLLYLRAYLFTCSTPGIKEKLQKLMWPREHFYEHVHLYSVSDLVLICRGGILSDVQEAVCFARLHIKGCLNCQARGFHCEICRSHQVIFPYELDTAQTCPDCCAVYHRQCTAKVTECPRCVRRKERKMQVIEVEEVKQTVQDSR